MKKNVFKSFILVSLVITCILMSFSLSASNVGPGEDQQSIIQWIIKNWSYVALVLSEVAALLPSKVKGIIQMVILIIGSIVKAIADSSKKTP